MMLFWIGLTFGFMAGNAFALGLVALAIARRPAEYSDGFRQFEQPEFSETVTIVAPPADGKFTLTMNDPKYVQD